MNSMRSKPSTVSATATLNRLAGQARVAEVYIGGAADVRSKLVISYADRRRRIVEPDRAVKYFTHLDVTMAAREMERLARQGHAIALVGHSWGADAAIQALRRCEVPALLIGVDPVAKPGSFWTTRDLRPACASRVLHVDAVPETFDRSDVVKAAGYMTGGGIPRAFRKADALIRTRHNHWNFAGMMAEAGDDGRSAEDWLSDA